MKNFGYQIKKGIALLFFVLLISIGTSSYAEKEIKVGVIGPMKFAMGQQVWYAASLAAQEINEAGGIIINKERYKLKLTKADSNEIASLQDAVGALERLYTVQKVDLVIGGMFSEAVLAMQEVMADQKKIFITPGSAEVEQCARLAKNYEKYKYFFRVMQNNYYLGKIASQQFMMVVDKLRDELGVKKPKVALLYQKQLWAETNLNAALSDIPPEEIEIVGKWSVPVRGTEVNAEMSAIKAAEPHIIFSFLSGPVAVPIAKTWGALKVPAAITGVITPAMSLRYWDATSGGCNYIQFGDPIARIKMTEKTLPFYDKLLAMSKDTPSWTAVGTYDAFYIVKDAIERAQSIDTEALIAAIEETDLRGVVGRLKFFPRNHKWPHDMMGGPGYNYWIGTQWRDGTIKAVWPDGRARLGEKGYEGEKYKGTVAYELPPWMVKYWKGKK